MSLLNLACLAAALGKFRILGKQLYVTFGDMAAR